MTQHNIKIAICGAGTMGAGIAQLCVENGFSTILFDANVEALEKARTRIEQQAHTTLITYTNDISDCRADIIIEAIIENSDEKSRLFTELSEQNSEATIFATNTSSLSVTTIAEQTKQPGRIAGLHFFNPATIMKLVEIISTPHTQPEVISRLTDFAKKLGKTPVLCKDAPGFIVNHVARPYYLESLYLAEKNEVEVSLIDTLLENSGFRMGPFRLMDLIGNDINYSVSQIVYEALGKPERLRPSPLQQQKVEKGLLGRKSGKGYYEYPAR